MAERVAFAPFLKEAQPQRAVQRIEEDRNVHRRFQCRRSDAELAQGDLGSADGSGQPQHPAQGLVHERQSHPDEDAPTGRQSCGKPREVLTVFVRSEWAAVRAHALNKLPDE